MEYKDYYEIMGLQRDATDDDIRRAYRKLARKYHPDVSKENDAEARFKEIGEAYEVLKDKEKRAAYDQLGSNWKAGEEFRPPPDWQQSSGHADPADINDFFESLFGRGKSSGFHQRNADRHARIMIDLEDAYTGATRTITLQTPGIDAQGRETAKEQKFNVTIPRGIVAGQHMRLNDPAGDLYLEIAFRPHRLYQVKERDVYINLPVAPWEAALGATVKVPTPGGVVDLRIPANFTSGRKLRLKGRGIPAKTPGDLYAIINVVLPPADDDKAKAFYQQMATQFDTFKPRSGLGV
ncbi:MAG: DnaJ C-terminal domain-containing protein [Gammaproteobacteria bacterium]